MNEEYLEVLRDIHFVGTSSSIALCDLNYVKDYYDFFTRCKHIRLKGLKFLIVWSMAYILLKLAKALVPIIRIQFIRVFCETLERREK